jgi:hypothetical protein
MRFKNHYASSDEYEFNACSSISSPLYKCFSMLALSSIGRGGGADYSRSAGEGVAADLAGAGEDHWRG